MTTDTRATIESRIIASAVARFSASNPGEGDGLFTTANYAQALKDEFGGPIQDTGVCKRHLLAMAGVESAGSCLWRSKAAVPTT